MRISNPIHLVAPSNQRNIFKNIQNCIQYVIKWQLFHLRVSNEHTLKWTSFIFSRFCKLITLGLFQTQKLFFLFSEKMNFFAIYSSNATVFQISSYGLSCDRSKYNNCKQEQEQDINHHWQGVYYGSDKLWHSRDFFYYF